MTANQTNSGTNKTKPRFIAGAACPKCSEQDSLRWWVTDSIEWVECVCCSFKEQRHPEKKQQSVAEPEIIGLFRP